MERIAHTPKAQDIRPILWRSATNSWSKTEEVRDQIYNSFQRACATNSIEALVLKSGPSVYPPWAKFECWVSHATPGVMERASILVTIEPKPYHRFPFEFQIDWTYGDSKKTLKQIIQLADKEINELVNYLLGMGSKPRLRRLRTFNWQFWRPRNKVKNLMTDFLGMLGGVLYLGAIVLGLSIFDDGMPPPVKGFLILLGIAMWLGGRAISKRSQYIRTEGKPYSDPRYLTRVDSWQTVIFGMGSECPMIRSRFLEKLDTAPKRPLSVQLSHLDASKPLIETTDFKYRIEQIWYWGKDGKEEREQIVITSGRGIVFCQIYQYGHDLYVGWDGHLNKGQWVEKSIAKGIDTTSWGLTSFNVVVPGTQTVSEYDLIDLNCLMEWVHAQIVKILKDLIEEKKIDQEIDFKILRGERQKLTTSESTERNPGFFRGMLKRTA